MSPKAAFIKDLRRRVPALKKDACDVFYFKGCPHTLYFYAPNPGQIRVSIDNYQVLLPGKRRHRLPHPGQHGIEITVAEAEIGCLMPFVVGVLLDIISPRAVVYERSPRAVAISHGAPRRVGKTPARAWLLALSANFRIAGAP